MMDNLKEFMVGAAYVSGLVGIIYVTLVVVGNAIGVGL
tara:strand:- start:516 stop:629 length:114 start_codon:yes stop_codon:yes gene_type:complete